MEILSLNGAWSLLADGRGQAWPATVPGCVHTDLLANGAIPDPFYRTNEHELFWIGETDWVYRRTFEVPASLLGRERLVLRCEGLDTLATLSLNGHELGAADNMFRTWEFALDGLLKSQGNRLEVRFQAPMPYVNGKEAERRLPAWGVGDHKLNGGGYLRKEPCNFGWDWGPMVPTCGIWREISICGWDHARLADVQLTQRHQRGKVTVTAAVTAERRDGGGLTVIARVLDGEVVVAEKTTTLRAETARVPLVVTDPKLWWPNDLGEQPLYRVEIELRDGERLLDTWSRRIGLRTLRLDRHPDQWGESFQFSINGLPFFAKGANWIPADAFVTRVTRDDYARLLGDAAAAHMNMLRVWGGGTYERDDFYELCDELGICVWQDFMFACATYPAFDAAFLDNVKAEAEDNVKRLRHHACLALWCGNNELEQGLVADEWTGSAMSWEDYGKLFDQLLPEVVGRLDPERDYWPCSPHTPPPGDRKDFNNPDRGDAHLWSVWHGKQPFEWYRTCTHRFNSEFGFQSFPEPRTVASYTEPADRNITSYVMEHHQRSGIGNATILHYLLSWFRLPTAFASTLWLSQIVQGMAIKYAVEHWRRAMPRGMGTIYWQLNDNWPVASWSSIDYPGRWKALHYLARRFFAPLLVSGLEDAQNGTVEVHVTSDRLEAVEAEVAWRVTDIAGGTLAEGAQTRRIGPRRNTRVQTLKLGKPLAEHGPRGLLVWLELRVGGELVSSNFVSFARPKHLELLAPEIAVEVHGDGREHHLRLSAAHPALWAWVEVEGAEARLSDSFVHLRPGESTDLTVTLDRAMTAAELQQRLKVSSLFDTYQ